MNDLSNSFTNDDLRGMITGNNPVSNAYRELLAYREAQGKPVGIIRQVCGNKTLVWANDMPEGTVLYAAPQLPAVPDGLALVPIEPTNEMRDAWFFMEDFDSEWAAMLAAGPKPNSET